MQFDEQRLEQGPVELMGSNRTQEIITGAKRLAWANNPLQQSD